MDRPPDTAFYVERRRDRPRTSWPLISCVMPTHDRPRLAARAAWHFVGQHYRRAELIVVDDSAVPAPWLPRDPQIAKSGARTIGAKRNLRCELGRGELVANWDDD